MTRITKKFRVDHDDLTFGKPRILFVEDDLHLTALLIRAIGVDYDIVHAVDGLQASQLLADRSFDLILSDLLLPGISGVDLLQMVRSYDLDVPLVILTGYPAIDTAIEAVRLGALQYLVKPIETEVLVATIERGVRLSRLARTKKAALAVAAAADAASEPVFMGDRIGLRARFDRAMRNLRLVFQPIVNVREKRIVAYEALMRSREDALPSPGAVLDAAERLGLINEVGRAVRQLAADAVPLIPHGADLFVNLHTAELADEELFSSSCPLVPYAERIVLEVTERASIDGVVDLTRGVRQLRETGFRLALDDLGAGYAGLSAFAALEPEIVKVDMSLVRDIQSSVVKQQIVGSLVTLCRGMNMRVVAEGVETRDELACVTQIGCDLIQGYYLGKPEKNFSTKTSL